MKRFAFRIDYLGLQVYDIWNPLSRFVAVSFAFPLFLGMQVDEHVGASQRSILRTGCWSTLLGWLLLPRFRLQGHGRCEVRSPESKCSWSRQIDRMPGTVLRRHCADKSAHTPTHTHRQTITDKHISIWSHYRNVKSNNKNTDTDSNKAIAAATTISAKQHNKPHETTTAITPTTAISSQQPTAKNMRKIISLASSQPSSVDHLNPALKCMSSNLTCPGLSWDDTQLNGSSS